MIAHINVGDKVRILPEHVEGINAFLKDACDDAPIFDINTWYVVTDEEETHSAEGYIFASQLIRIDTGTWSLSENFGLLQEYIAEVQHFDLNERLDSNV